MAAGAKRLARLGTDAHIRSQPGNRGMTTLELAVGVLTVSILAAILAWGVSLMVVYNHCSDTAAAVARYMAIGDTSKAKQARQNAPTGATISVIERSTTVEVVVSADERFGLIGPIHLVSSFTQLKEPK